MVRLLFYSEDSDYSVTSDCRGWWEMLILGEALHWSSKRWWWLRPGQGQQTSSVKHQVVNISGFVSKGLQQNYSTLLLWCRKSHRQYICEWAWLWSNESLFTKAGSWPDLVWKLWFPDPCPRMMVREAEGFKRSFSRKLEDLSQGLDVRSRETCWWWPLDVSQCLSWHEWPWYLQLQLQLLFSCLVDNSHSFWLFFTSEHLS